MRRWRRRSVIAERMEFRRYGGAGWRWLLVGVVWAGAGWMMARAAERWVAVQTAHFTVLTAAAPTVAQAWAAELEQFRIGLGKIMPANAARLQPVTVVIFANDKAFRPYKPLQKGKPAAVGGFFSHTDDVNVIGLALGGDEARTRHVVFHEATHWFSSTRDDPLPAWLEEGIAEVFSTFRAVSRQKFVVGEPPPGQVAYLRHGTLTPLPKLIGTARGLIDFNDEDRTGRFYAESWLLVHWLMFGEKSPGEASIARYLELVKTTPNPAQAFAEAFGGSYADVQRKVTHYLTTGRYVRQTYTLTPDELAHVTEPRPATEAEVEFALGSLLFGAQGAQAARPRLQRAAELAPGEAQAWALLGFACVAMKDEDGALVAFEHAAEAGSRNALVWYNRATLRLSGQRSVGQMIETSDPGPFTEAAKDFRHALELDPQCRSAYAGLAGVTYAAEPFDAEDVARLQRGCALFPDDLAIRGGLACARVRTDPGQGEAELRAVRAAAEDGPRWVRSLADSVLESLEFGRVKTAVQRATEERRYDDAVREVDAALARGVVSGTNRAQLKSVRRQLDQMQRIDQAAAVFNDGDPAKARVLLLSVQAEEPATWVIRNEIVRLLKLCDEAADAGG